GTAGAEGRRLGGPAGPFNMTVAASSGSAAGERGPAGLPGAAAPLPAGLPAPGRRGGVANGGPVLRAPGGPDGGMRAVAAVGGDPGGFVFRAEAGISVTAGRAAVISSAGRSGSPGGVAASFAVWSPIAPNQAPRQY